MTFLGTVTEMYAVTPKGVWDEKRTDLMKKSLVKWCRTTEIKRKAMTEHGHGFGNFTEPASEPAAHIDPVFRSNFHEINRRVVMIRKRAYKGPPQTQPGAMHRVGISENVRHQILT